MSWDIAAAGAVDGLVAAAQTTSATVCDSFLLVDDSAQAVIVVAGSVNRVDTARQEIKIEWIEHQFEAPGYNMNQLETFTIISEVGYADFDGDISVARAAGYQVIADWGRAIEADVTLGGAVDHAWISTVGWKPRIEDNGLIALFQVAINCEAFTGA